MTVRSRLVLAAAASLSLAANTTASTWTGAAGNGLWFDPGNWSSGVPSATTPASVSGNTAVSISLGGQIADASSVGLFSSAGTNLTNGTLRTSQLSSFESYPTSVGVDLVLTAGSTGNASIDGISLSRGFSESSSNRPTLVTLSSVTVSGAAVATHVSASNTDFAIGGSLAATSLEVFGPVSFQQLQPGGDRISDGTAVTLTDDYYPLTFTSGAAGASERIGQVSVPVGSPSLVLSGAAAATLRIGHLDVAEGAALRWQPTGAAGHRLIIEDAPALIGGSAGTGIHRGVASWALLAEPRNQSLGVVQQLLTYDAGADPADSSDDVGLRSMDVQNEFVQGIADGANSRIATAATVSGNVSPKVLLIDGSNTLSVPASTSVNIADGALAFAGRFNSPRVSGDGPINFTGQSQILAFNRGTSYIDAPVDAQTLTLVLAENLQFERVNAIGTLRVNGAYGSVKLNAVDALPGTNVQIIGDDARVELLKAGHYTFDVTGGAGRTMNFTGSANGAVMLDGNVGGVETLRFRDGAFAVSQPLTDVSRIVVQSGSLTLPHPVALTSLAVGDTSVPGQDNPTVILSGAVGQLTMIPSGSLDIGPGISSLDVGQFTQIVQLAFPPAPATTAGTFIFDLDVVDGTERNDVLSIESIPSNPLRPAHPFAAILRATPAVVIGDEFTLIHVGAMNGTLAAGLFAGLQEGAIVSQGGLQYELTYLGGDGNDVAVRVVPEPAAALALVLLPLSRRRRRG